MANIDALASAEITAGRLYELVSKIDPRTLSFAGRRRVLDIVCRSQDSSPPPLEATVDCCTVVWGQVFAENKGPAWGSRLYEIYRRCPRGVIREALKTARALEDYSSRLEYGAIRSMHDHADLPEVWSLFLQELQDETPVLPPDAPRLPPPPPGCFPRTKRDWSFFDKASLESVLFREKEHIRFKWDLMNILLNQVSQGYRVKDASLAELRAMRERLFALSMEYMEPRLEQLGSLQGNAAVHRRTVYEVTNPLGTLGRDVLFKFVQMGPQKLSVASGVAVWLQVWVDDHDPAECYVHEMTIQGIARQSESWKSCFPKISQTIDALLKLKPYSESAPICPPSSAGQGTSPFSK